MGNLPIHIYGYNNEHDVIVYTVECGQPRHRLGGVRVCVWGGVRVCVWGGVRVCVWGE